MNDGRFMKKEIHHILYDGADMDMSQIDKYEKLGLNIAYYRHMRRLTQEQLSEKADIDRTHLSNIELANSAASLDVIFHLADALNVPVYKLFEFRD